ncbi:MAG: SNF2-related protein, partial [Pseudomonadota bacterium]|nr:SNF2-related protein [Pseudomonadota bacterium]
MTTSKKRTRKTQKRPRFTGWSTSDADEIERSRLRGCEEAIRIEPLDRVDAFYGAFLAHSNGGHAYRVEIRSLTGRINSCDCLDRRSNQVRILWPIASRQRSRARSLLTPFFNDEGNLPGDPLDKLPALERAISASPASVRRRIRLSNALQPWLEIQDRRAEQIRTRQHFEAAVAAGKESLDTVKMPLYAYQQEGMLHLAFTGRALLADEMGLGKTVQAVAACTLLRRLHRIRRVLVIAPASLKAEWEEQIAKFSDLPSLIIQGTRAQRLRQYEQSAFFYLANYEQIRPDAKNINQTLAPDVIILDEAQRIKNWQTKTATAVKQLTSRYAFVLTGTPVENRIDEIYSIAQFLDPHLFGPLFRFNRDFYQLDERGHAIGYKNLDK